MNNAAAIDWNAVLTECRPKVFGYLRSRLNNPQDAEDLTQQVLIKAYRNRESHDPTRAQASTWVYHIAKTALIDFYRVRKDHASLDSMPEITNTLMDTSDGPEEQYLNSEAQETLAEALERMDEQERDLIILHYYQNTSLTEIARMMDLPYGRIKRMHTRALAQLQLLIGNRF